MIPQFSQSQIRRLTGYFVAGLILWLGLSAQSAKAGFFIFDTQVGATANTLPVNVTVSITTLNGQVLLAVTNNQSNPTSDIQTLNGISFQLSTGQTAVSSFTEQAVQRTVLNNNPGGYTSAGTAATLINSPDKWNAKEAGLGVEITSIGNSGGHGGLIGNPNASNAYAAANSSITNANHNPFIAGTATFTLNIAGVTASSNINAVRFEFGTAAGTNVDAKAVPVPEPASLGLIGLGLGSIGLVRLIRRKRQATN